MQDPTTPESGYETTDVAMRPVTIAGLFIVGLLLVSMVLMRGLLGTLGREEAAASAKASPLVGYGPQTPPEPRLQTDPAGDIRTLRAAEQARLDRYGWVDQAAGTVHVPIERAMDLLAARRGRTTP